MASQHKKIVVADFDPETTEFVRTVLAARGHRVATARDGVEATELIRAEDPDVVVLNGVLRGRSGFSICREIASRPDGGPAVVLLLETDDTYVRGLARSCGAREAFVKPVDPEALGDWVQRRIRRPDVKGMLKEREAEAAGKDREPEDFDLKAGEGSFLEPFLDPDSGVFNRTYLIVRLLEEYKKTRRYGTPLSAAVIALEKDVPPDEASDAMAQAGGLLLVESRDTDITGRLDERRFLLLLTNTGLPGAAAMMRRVLGALRRALPDGPRFHAGLAVAPHPDHAGPEDFIGAAERAAANAIERRVDVGEGE
jgi:DNA-binding response OmpR family regulator